MQSLREHLDVISRIKEEVGKKGGGKIIFLTISGSHLYGFESPDSDIDYRGTFVTNTNNLLGLKSTPTVIEMKDGNNDIHSIIRNSYFREGILSKNTSMCSED